MDRRTARGTLLVVWLAVHLAALPAASGLQPGDAPTPAAPSDDGWLGVWLTDAVDGGVQVVALWPGGPAERGGLRAGDTVIEAGGEPVGDREDLARAIARLGAGDAMPIVVLRGQKEHRVVVHLGSKSHGALVPRPPVVAQAPTPAPPDRPRPLAWAEIGLEVETMTAALRRHLGAPESAGVLVTRVEAGQVADRAGLRVGDVIVRLGDEEIASAGQARVTLVPWRLSEPVTALVVRERKPVRIELRGSPRSGQAVSSPEAVRRRIEAEIERLERRIADLRRELEDLESPD